MPQMPRRKDRELSDELLSEKENRFIELYLHGPNAFNGAACAREAGFAKKSAKVTASRLLDKPKILQELARRRQRLMDRIELSRDRVLEEIRRMAFAKITDVVEWDEDTARMKPSEYLGEEIAAAVAEVHAHVRETLVDVQPGGEGKHERVALNRDATVRVKMHPKLPALQTLLAELSPTPAERRGAGSGGLVPPPSGVTIIVEGGQTGLEITVSEKKDAA
jgi:phage terminase small subunit